MKSLFEIASNDLRETLNKSGRTKKYRESVEIFAEDEKATFLPIIISGKVKMVKFPEVGKEVIIGIFQTGEMFAVPPAFDGQNYPSTAIATEETQLLLISRRDFLQILSDSSEFSFYVIDWMCEMLREKTATIKNLVTASPEHRVGNILLHLAKKENVEFPLKISLRRKNIAEMTGLTTETTIRSVKKLSKKKLIKIVRGKIFIERTDKLRAFLR